MTVNHPYYETIHLIERLHRQFLDLLKIELDRSGVQDINNVQSLILFNIADDELTVGELTARGYYLGSNVSYNLKKMVENGYLQQERSIHDRRSIRVRLSPKGHELRKRLIDMFERHIARVSTSELKIDDLPPLNKIMTRLERFWASQLGFASAPFSSSTAA